MAIARVDSAAATGSGTTATGTLPSYSSGDVFVCTVTSGGAAPSAPAGWTSQVSAKQDVKSIALFTRVAGASESAPAFTVTSGNWTVIIESFSGVDTSTPVRATGVNQSGFTNNPTVTVNGVITDDTLIVAAFAQNQGSYTATISGMTVRHTIGGDITVFADQINITGGNITKTVAWSGFTYTNVVGLALKPAAGGTTYNQSVSGAMTPSGAITKASARSLAGALTSAGTLAKSETKSLAGALTSASSLVLSATRTLSGALASSGTLVRSTGTALVGLLTPAGDLFRQASRAFAGAISPDGALARAFTRVLSGSLTPTGVLSAARIYLVELAGALPSAGTIVRAVIHLAVGTIGPIGSIGRGIGRALSGLINLVGSLISSGGTTQEIGRATVTAQQVTAAVSAQSITARVTVPEAISGTVAPSAVTATVTPQIATAVVTARNHL